MAELRPRVELPPIAFASLPRPWPAAEALDLFANDRPLRISVVLPACNEAQLLQRTFEQLRATLPARSEIIVVDNGSIDGCADFLADQNACPSDGTPRSVDPGDGPTGVTAWLLRYPEPLGPAGARNVGLAQARGEVIVFADANVDVPPGWWPPLVATLNRPGVGVVGPAISEMGRPDQGKLCGMFLTSVRLDVSWLHCTQETPRPVPAIAGAMMVFRRDLLAIVGSFDPEFRQRCAEDTEICLRLWLLGYEVWVVPEVEMAHFHRNDFPYPVDWTGAQANFLRLGLLHLGTERLTGFLQSWKDAPDFSRAMAITADSDVGTRRAELLARRCHDDEWFFNHPYFHDIPQWR